MDEKKIYFRGDKISQKIDSEHNDKVRVCCNKLQVFDWLKNIKAPLNTTEIVEICFKNTRKGYFENINHLKLKAGDLVAVEASPGHDIGSVSLTGELVLQQLRKNKITLNSEFKKIYRKAKLTDIQKWEDAIEKEKSIMLKARKIAENLKLNMKIGDVEMQGDHTKAIFYYIADERVDFRQLIKKLAEEFRLRIEMKQIGARQEAGRIGGIGSCGRELCCSTCVTNFNSVTTNSAREQDLSLNPQKLAGQCGKLKCCLNYEVDSYISARNDFPASQITLETTTQRAYYQKSDVYKRIMWYSIDKENSSNIIPIPVERVKEIIKLNKNGKKPEVFLIEKTPEELKMPEGFKNVVEEDSITRFDNQKTKRKKRKKRKKNTGSQRNNQNQQPQKNKPKLQKQSKKQVQNKQQNKTQQSSPKKQTNKTDNQHTNAQKQVKHHSNIRKRSQRKKVQNKQSTGKNEKK